MADVIEHAFMDVLGLRTFYAKAGSGPAVVMIHGGSPGACSLVNWKLNIVPIARAGFTVYAFDQPGFGETDIPSDHSMEFRVAHAFAFVAALGLARFHVVGNSMGAYIAARVALENENVGRLVLASSSTLAPRGSDKAAAIATAHHEELRRYEPSLDEMRAMTLKTLFRKDLVTEELVRERYEMSRGRLHEAMLERQKCPPARSLAPELSRLAMPTLLLWGANDRGAAVERAVLLFDALPNAELHVFSNCAHWVHWDQAERFNRLVADFLAET